MTVGKTQVAAPRDEETVYDPKTMLDERQERYLQWLLTPAPERQPASKTKLAEELGVSFKTMTDWGKKRAFKERLEAEAKETRDPAATAAIMKALKAKAEGGDVRAAEAFLKATGQWNLEPERERSSLQDMSTDELKVLLVDLAGDELRRRGVSFPASEPTPS